MTTEKDQLRIIRQSIPDRCEVAGSIVGTVQNYIGELEQEIAKRDARIAELEAIVPIESELRAKAEQATTELERDLAALKAQQPSAGVAPGVLAECFFHALPDEDDWEVHDPWHMSGDCDGCVRAVIVSRDTWDRLNPCRAQAADDNEELKVLRAFYRCCTSITDQLADSPKSAFARLVEAVKDSAPSAKKESE